MDQAIELALIEMGIGLTGQAMLLAPVLSGRLAGSITWATKSKQSDVVSPGNLPGEKGTGPGATNKDRISRPTKKHELWYGTNVEYAEAIEYSGTQDLSYLRRSLDLFRDDLPKLLWKSIEKHYGKPF